MTKFGHLNSLQVTVFVVIDMNGKVGPFKDSRTAYYFKNCLNNGDGKVYQETWTGEKALKALQRFERTASLAKDMKRGGVEF